MKLTRPSQAPLFRSAVFQRQSVAFPVTLIALLLSLANPASAERGGKGGGKGNGGGSEEPPALVKAPVNYEITTIHPEEPGSLIRLIDINRDGLAVGWVRPLSTGNNEAIAATDSGTLIELNELYFHDMQSTFSGWRFNHAVDINSAGDFAGVLVPNDQYSSSSSNKHILVTGHLPSALTSDNPLLIAVATFEDGSDTGDFHNIGDQNEHGDLVLTVYINSDYRHQVYRSPQLGILPPIFIERPANAIANGFLASINSNGQIAQAVQATKRKFETIIQNLDSEIPELNLGHFGRGPRIAESGAVYDTYYSSGITTQPLEPHRWNPTTGVWESVAPPSWIGAVSKAIEDEEVLLQANADSPDPSTPMIYRPGVGTYPLQVTGPQAEVAIWINSGEQKIMSGISRPTASGFGFIAGHLGIATSELGVILKPQVTP